MHGADQRAPFHCLLYQPTGLGLQPMTKVLEADPTGGSSR